MLCANPYNYCPTRDVLMLKRLTLALTLLVLGYTVAMAGVEGTKAAYLGGTSTAFKGTKSLEGVFDTTNADALRFVYRMDKTEHTFAIPYASVVELKYGQKPGMMSLFSRKRTHYLTIGFKDFEGKDQVAVFELGKRIVRPTHTILEHRTGRAITMEK
jgi:hypothetical protein